MSAFGIDARREPAAVRPGGEIRADERRDPRLVRGEVGGGEARAPLAGSAAAEEGAHVLPESPATRSARRRHRARASGPGSPPPRAHARVPVSTGSRGRAPGGAAHPRGRPASRRSGRGRRSDRADAASPCRGDAAPTRASAARRASRRRRRSGTARPGPRTGRGAPAARRGPRCRRPRRAAPGSARSPCWRRDAPRDGDVTRIAADHEIRDVGVQRKAVEGRVRLDEAAMRLGGERRRHLGERADAHVEPRRDLVERRRERGPVEDQERAQHLRPGGAALRRGADHDVARTEREPVPAAAVGDDRAVARARSLCVGHRAILLRQKTMPRTRAGSSRGCSRGPAAPGLRRSTHAAGRPPQADCSGREQPGPATGRSGSTSAAARLVPSPRICRSAPRARPGRG